MLIACALVSLLLAYRNLTDLWLTKITAEPVFAGQQAEFRLWLEDRDNRHRPLIQIALDKPRDCLDLAPLGAEALKVCIEAPQRGLLALPDCRIETRYPMGWFRAWSWVRPNSTCLVYPRPSANPPPLPYGGEGYSNPGSRGDGDELHSLREYRQGDPLNRIAWRTSARHDQLYAKVTVAPQGQAVSLDWHQLRGFDTESRVSILCSWVLTAERRQLHYTLRLPGAEIPAGLGDEQRGQCLRALALFGS